MDGFGEGGVALEDAIVQDQVVGNGELIVMVTTPNSHDDLLGRDAELLTHLGQRRGVDLCVVGFPEGREEVLGDVLLEPLVLAYLLNGDPFYRVNLQWCEG